MKFWLIYRTDLGEPFVYGITDDKKIKDKFWDQRKHSKFYIKEFSVPKKEYLNALKSYSQLLLLDHGLLTKSKDSITGLGTIPIIITSDEEIKLYTSQDRLTIEMGKMTKPYCKTFKPKLLEALYDLQYFYFRAMQESPIVEPFLPELDRVFQDNWPFQAIDEFGVFMMLFGNTLNLKKILKKG